ncbi:MAG: type IV pilus twitching motility protein PilT [Candidatus Saccharibacteria bacterium]|nr:type IV pilus twitching motility protein PilT [Candidatus Saccharibacteria bacterium]MCY4010483.1 type IV pilus twitching motility protein PilT [Candidatus Saccharibacteria bacterium]MCY4088994.1 type IV pilus twitching motility protein PilT [Candidatus Saccharibacteria bacterium]
MDLRIEVLLQEVVNLGASDLHLQVGTLPMVRQQGELIEIIAQKPLTPADIESLIFAILDDEQKSILLKNKEVDCGFSFGELGRFRVNVFHEKGNLAASLRLIPSRIPSLDDLGLPAVVSTFAQYKQGLVLFTGPTGSGKSSSMAALIHKINEERKERIITIEDPIEFVHSSKRSIVVQREVHYDTYSFAAALRSALRQDPDIVLVGELRDLETISAALTIAETGHLVFGTLHTNSAPQTINRIIDVFPPHQQAQIRIQLSNTLKATCAQYLVPNIEGTRSVATEILIVDSAVSNLIRESKIHQIDSIIQGNAALGMQGMDQTLAKMVQAGIITYDNGLKVARNPSAFKNLTQGM